MRALMIGMILGALALATLQHYTQTELNQCRAERSELLETVNAF